MAPFTLCGGALGRFARRLLGAGRAAGRAPALPDADALTLDIAGETLQFPHAWLRDNCQCRLCYHPSARSRLLDWREFKLDARPARVCADAEGVRVTWDDGHASHYRLDWLKRRSFAAEHQRAYGHEMYRPPKVSWSGDRFRDCCKAHDYGRILAHDAALYDWLMDLSTYGVTLVENAPRDEGSLDAMVRRVGFPKRTHHGSSFVVRSVADAEAGNVAYLPSALQPHTDLPYYQHCPGVVLLHCLVQTASQGGVSTLADGRHVAEHMRQRHAEHYRALAETEVEWCDVGVERGRAYHKLYRAPVICADRRGEVARINFSVPQRGSHFPAPIDRVKAWYAAHALFYQLSGKFAARHRLEAGQVLAFDNTRLLHGRDRYVDSVGNVRKLIGVYVDWDEVYSRLRCLKVELEGKTWY